ncbi:MAG: hypothetical protein GXO03_00730 [Aquificae bacterium]|nr:hypothetical protein [Aquificota bacterium]
MELFFFVDVYADRELIDYYIVNFTLEDPSSVELSTHAGKYYVRGIKDLERFKRSVKRAVLSELGEKVGEYETLEEALKEAYERAVSEAISRGAKEIVPAVGFCNPPPELIKEVFPLPYAFDPFPENLEAYLDELAKKVTGELRQRLQDEDELSF